MNSIEYHGMLTAQRMLAQRRLAANVFGEAVSIDPALDILLFCYIARKSERQIKTTDACRASRSPYTTAVRWLERLEKMDFLKRPGKFGGRVRYVSISDYGMYRVDGYLASVKSLDIDL